MVVDTQIQKFVWCSPGSLVILFIRDDCGPFEIIKNTSICIIIWKHLQFLGSARRTAMKVQVDLGRLKAGKTTLSTETWVRRSWAAIVTPVSGRTSSLSNLNLCNPSQAVGRGLVFIIRHQSSWKRNSRLQPERNGVIGCVCGDFCPFGAWVLLDLVELSRAFIDYARFRSSRIWSPLKPPRAPSIRVSSWFRVRAGGETRGKIRDRSPKVALAWSGTRACWKTHFRDCIGCLLYKPSLRFDTVEGW